MPLIERSVEKLRIDNPKHPGLFKETSRFFEGEPDREQLSAILGEIAGGEEISGDGRKCLIIGLGSQTRRVYRYLKNLSGNRVLWEGSCLPMLAYPISWITAAHMGLIQIDDRRQLTETFEILSNLAMVELYSFSADLVSDVHDHVHRHTWRSRIGQIIGTDPTYFYLGADGDFLGETGIIAWCSGGPNCPVAYPTGD